MNPKFVLGAFLACSLTVTPVVVLGHGGASGVVKERMDAMKEMKDAMKSLSAMFSGKADYDADKVRQAAAVLEQNAGQSLTGLFPQGSDHSPSEAKANIWQEWEQFGQMADDLKLYSRALAEAADKRAMHTGGSDASGMMGGGHMMGTGQADGHMMAGSMMSGSMMSGSMMHGGMMAHGRPSAEHLAEMPADMLFKMVTDSCSSCHTRYRQEDK